MAKDSEYHVKERVEKGIGEAANGLRKKGREIQEYLKQVRAEVEEWKFGVEESNDGFRVEWRMVALIRRPKKKD